MPIASGAAGRVDVGAGTPAGTTWTPDGPRKKPLPTNRNRDSYLQRYQEVIQSKKNKMNTPQAAQDDTDPSNQENDGAKEEGPPGGSEGPASGGRPKKSRLCVIL